MLIKAIEQTNSIFEDTMCNLKLKEDLSGGEQDYEMYSARKNGHPRDDYPSKQSKYLLNLIDFDLSVQVKNAGVKNNLFCVLFTESAVVSSRKQ